MAEVIEDKTPVLTKKPEVKDLFISCVDEVGVRARITFDCEEFDGLRITYWPDDEQDIEKRIDSIFAMLFEEIIKTNPESSKLLKL